MRTGLVIVSISILWGLGCCQPKHLKIEGIDTPERPIPPKDLVQIQVNDESTQPLTVTLNRAYVNYPYQKEFTWFMKVAVTTDTLDTEEPLQKEKLGNADPLEAQILHSIQDGSRKMHYIGRSVSSSKMLIYCYVDDPSSAEKSFLVYKRQLNYHWRLDYELFEDKQWRQADSIYKRYNIKASAQHYADR